VKDANAFVEQLNRHVADGPRHPIEIKWYDDPEWQIWRQALDLINDRAGLAH
jgi:hypothetical protein